MTSAPHHKFCTKCFNAKNTRNGQQNNVNFNVSDDYVNANVFYAEPSSMSVPLEIHRYLHFYARNDRRDVDVMVDTGSSISLCHSSILFAKEESCDLSVRFGNGTTQALSKRRLVKLSVGNSPLYVWCYVSDLIPTDVLLGMDFLCKKSIIDLKRKLMLLSYACFESHSASVLTRIRDTDLFEEDFPILKSLPKSSKLPWKSMVIDWILKFSEKEKREGWIYNRKVRFPIHIKDDARPVYKNPIVYNGPEREIIENQIREWYSKGVIRKAVNPVWASQVIISSKFNFKDPDTPSHRVCPNFIPLNDATLPMKYPLPDPRRIVNDANGKYKSLIDCAKGYLRFEIEEQHKHLTTIITQPIEGLGDVFEFNLMPWGTCNAGRFYQFFGDNLWRTNIIGGKHFARNMKGDCVEAFQDDSLFHSDDEKSHFDDINEGFERMFYAGVVPNWTKSVICQEELKYCGFLLTPDGIRQDPDRIKILSQLKFPSTYNELDIFIGMANWHREFIPNFASVMRPLIDLQQLNRRSVRFSFSDVHRRAMKEFIRLLSADVLLSRPGPGTYEVYADMSESNRSLSAQLIRVYRGRKYLISYASKRLSDLELLYSVPKLEFMAIWFAAMKFSPIFEGYDTTIFSDHRSLQDLHFKKPRKRWATWLCDLIDLNVRVKHIKGKDNVVANAMSRLSHWSNNIVVSDRSTQLSIVKHYHLHVSDRKNVQCIREKYDWDGIYSDVSKYTSSCLYCQLNRGDRVETRAPMTSITATQPHQIIGIDIKGPLTLRNGEKKHYGVAIDYFDKSTWLFGLKTYSSSEFWAKFEKRVLNYISTPSKVIGDRASNFLSSEAASYKQKYGFDYQPSTAYRHQANGEVENRIKTVDGLMHGLISEGYSYRYALRESEKIVNQRYVSDSTGFTPFEVSHGHKHMSPFDLKIQQLLSSQSSIRSSVQENIAKAQEQQRKYYDDGKVRRQLSVGDWVLVWNDRKSNWHQDKRIGPFKVEKKLPNDNYLVFDHLQHSWKEYNVEKLSKFIPLASPPDSIDLTAEPVSESKSSPAISFPRIQPVNDVSPNLVQPTSGVDSGPKKSFDEVIRSKLTPLQFDPNRTIIEID
jgi:hypothetical protein